MKLFILKMNFLTLFIISIKFMQIVCFKNIKYNDDQRNFKNQVYENSDKNVTYLSNDYS